MVGEVVGLRKSNKIKEQNNTSWNIKRQDITLFNFKPSPLPIRQKRTTTNITVQQNKVKRKSKQQKTD